MTRGRIRHSRTAADTDPLDLVDGLRRDPVRSDGSWGGAIPHADPASASRAARATRKATSSSSSSSSFASPARTTEPRGTPPPDEKAFGWERLEVAVRALVDQQTHLRDELASVRAELAEREHRIRRLETQLIEANHSRQDTGKRIDELISQLDQLDAQLATLEPE